MVGSFRIRGRGLRRWRRGMRGLVGWRRRLRGSGRVWWVGDRAMAWSLLSIYVPLISSLRDARFSVDRPAFGRPRCDEVNGQNGCIETNSNLRLHYNPWIHSYISRLPCFPLVIPPQLRHCIDRNERVFSHATTSHTPMIAIDNPERPSFSRLTSILFVFSGGARDSRVVAMV